MDKITSINGILLTAHNDFYEHEKNNSVHITEDERTAWNSKAEASEVNSKVSTETFDAHKADASVHITEEERNRWNTAPHLDESGNMTLAGSLTTAGTYNANGGINGKQIEILTEDEQGNWQVVYYADAVRQETADDSMLSVIPVAS